MNSKTRSFFLSISEAVGVEPEIEEDEEDDGGDVGGGQIEEVLV